jgi:two-component system, chemotaxis family, CheB/CheR fusion protein
MDTIDESSPVYNARLVIVGSSAGGVEALSRLVSTLPTTFPAPILLAQHLDPRRPSNLERILQQHSRLPVQMITAHTPLRAGTIYVVPPDCYVTLNDSYVEMQDHFVPRPKPSLDVLLSSAAHVYGKRLIAVILTGSGSDGAAGAIEVNRAGGTIIIQNPRTARFSSMPSSILPTIVDFQVDLERIGPLLTDVLTGAALLLEREQEDVLHHILQAVQRRMSIDVSVYKTSILLPHIEARMLATNSPTMRAYLDYLQAHPAEAGALVQALSGHTTAFFRDPERFTSLEQTVLPVLIQRARERNRTLRCWVLGCATGEEAYSLAMVISVLLGAELADWHVKIFATDLNEDAISFARHGWYPETLLLGLPAGYQERFFTSSENGSRVSKSLRQMVIFGKHDLSQDAPFPRIDLVLCRNVLPSFTDDFQQFLLKRLTFSLFPGGYLVLDREEKTLLPERYYVQTWKEENIYRCIEHAPPALQPPTTSSLPSSRSREVTEQGSGTPRSEQLPPRAVLTNEQVHPFYEMLFRSIPVGLIVIDRTHHVLAANSLARRLLRMPTTVGEPDFFHAIPGIPYQWARNAVDTAFREHDPVTLTEVELEGFLATPTRYVTFSIVPLQLPVPQSELAVISVLDVTEQVRTQRHLEAVQGEQEQLINELGTANERLQEVKHALLDAEQAVQRVNEDMALAQQELQAQTEEQETTIEELQASLQEMEATNEILQISNEELQARLELLEDSQEASKASPDSTSS